jgi:hypothetical protein
MNIVAINDLKVGDLIIPYCFSYDGAKGYFKQSVVKNTRVIISFRCINYSTAIVLENDIDSNIIKLFLNSKIYIFSPYKVDYNFEVLNKI